MIYHNIKGKIYFGPLDVIKRNLEFLSPTVYTTIFIIAICYIIVMMIKKIKKDIDFSDNIKKCIPYIIIFFFPIIWYIVLKQHSYTHVNFTYRLLIISVICVLIMASKILKEKNKEKISKSKIEKAENK